MDTRFGKFTAGIIWLLLVSAFISGCRRAKDNTSKPEVIKTKTGIEMVKIPGVFFEMGSKKGTPD